MPTHDIIDNRQERLVDHINRILSSTEAARFAAGLFLCLGAYQHRLGTLQPGCENWETTSVRGCCNGSESLTGRMDYYELIRK